MLKNYQNEHPETKQARVFTNMEMSTIMYGDMCAHCQDQLLVEKLIADLAFFGALRKQDLRRLTFGSFSEMLDGNIMVRLKNPTKTFTSIFELYDYQLQRITTWN